ncbi:MAG: MFS transporter [Bacteroidales bacterium]|jgi:OPA family sugar phosphate sensor protein UhpC-like MFS transporter|nr:MFS transporter [Bacteroidales bacterium]MBR2856798.1 MFS transporter [Bacteroidales bacterium]
MLKRFLEFYRVSGPSVAKVPTEKADKTYRKLRTQAFIAATIGYSLYYVCRTSLNVMKQPIIDAGFLDATQLGIIGACLYWTYAVGKFINGFLADHCNIKKFMATGLILSSAANFIMGFLGVWEGLAGVTGGVMFLMFAIMWTINGWSQSMGAPPAIISLSRWYPLKIRGTFYGFFSASHNFGEGLSFVFVSLLVGAAGWQWGFFGAALAGVLGVSLIILWLHDNPESKGLEPVEILAGEKSREQLEMEAKAKEVGAADEKAESGRIQRAVLRNPGVWILALSSAFMYMSRYAINEWGMFFLQKVKGFGLQEAAFIIAVNTVMGIIGTVAAGWISDTLFRGDRKWPALAAGILESIALLLFLYGGDSWFVNVLAMTLFGISIGVLICFIGGLMAVDLVPRKATGAALGIVGLASYVAAGLMNVISGWLIDGQALRDEVTGEIVRYDFTYVSLFWVGAAVISFILPIFNWKKRQQEI